MNLKELPSYIEAEEQALNQLAERLAPTPTTTPTVPTVDPEPTLDDAVLPTFSSVSDTAKF